MSGNIIQLNEDLIKNNLKDLVRNSVEETLNALLDHEADELVRAGKYERTGDRKGYRSGHYERNFGTTSGEVRLRVPKLKGIQFETAIIERYKRRECSVEEALIEMYLAGVSVRRVEDITELLWGTKVSYHRIALGHKGLLWHHQPSQPEGIQAHRGMASASFNGGISVCLRRRHLPQALLGWRDSKCLRFSRYWRQ